MLQIGGRFSIYAPPSCHRLEQPHFSLVLDCDFQGRRSRFYLREFPGQLNETFDPREFPPSKYDPRTYLNTALRAVVDEFDPGLIARLKFPHWGSNASDDADALFWEEGYLIDDQAGDPENINKCAFLRIQSYRRGLSAVLFAVSDVDHPSFKDRSSDCRGFLKRSRQFLEVSVTYLEAVDLFGRDRSNSVRVFCLDSPSFAGQPGL